MKTNVEKRQAKGIEIRAAAEGSPYIGTLVGYAAVFNSPSGEMRNASRPNPFVETIQAGAFKRSLSSAEESADIMGLWSHDDSLPFARLGKNMRLSEDERGLKVEIDVPDTSVGRDVLANVRLGIVDSMSFSFRARENDGQEWRKGDQRDERVLKDVTLYEVSPVVWPAYPETSLAEAAHDDFLRHCEKDPELRSWSPGGESKSDGKSSSEPAKGDEKHASLAYWEARTALLETHKK